MTINKSEYQRQWRKNNRDKSIISERKYRAKNAKKVRQWAKNWSLNNKERHAFLKYRRKDEVKREVLNFYGKGVISCVLCGFSDIRGLCLDHINDDGAKQRKELNISSRGGGAGSRTYEALIKHHLPPGLQILCANCNMIKEQDRHISNRILKNKLYADYYRSISI